MKSKTNFTLRLDTDDRQWIEGEAKRTGNNATEVIRGAIEIAKTHRALAETFEKSLAAVREEILEKLAGLDTKIEATGKLTFKILQQSGGEK
jgi:hypothetical protein